MRLCTIVGLLISTFFALPILSHANPEPISITTLEKLRADRAKAASEVGAWIEEHPRTASGLGLATAWIAVTNEIEGATTTTGARGDSNVWGGLITVMLGASCSANQECRQDISELLQIRRKVVAADDAITRHLDTYGAEIDAWYAANYASRLELPPVVNDISTLKAGDAFRECNVCPSMVVLPTALYNQYHHRNYTSGPPAHLPEFFGGYAIGQTKVTETNWQACVDAGFCEPGDFPNPTPNFDAEFPHRVEQVLNQASGAQGINAYIAFINSQTEGGYRLPTIEEHAYADYAPTALKQIVSCQKGARTEERDRYCNLSYPPPIASTSPNSNGVYGMYDGVIEASCEKSENDGTCAFMEQAGPGHRTGYYRRFPQEQQRVGYQSFRLVKDLAKPSINQPIEPAHPIEVDEIIYRWRAMEYQYQELVRDIPKVTVQTENKDKFVVIKDIDDTGLLVDAAGPLRLHYSMIIRHGQIRPGRVGIPITNVVFYSTVKDKPLELDASKLDPWYTNKLTNMRYGEGRLYRAGSDQYVYMEALKPE